MKNVGVVGKVFDARVEEVHSGDDFVLLVNLGVDGLYKKTRARLFGVDAPNAYKARGDTVAGQVREEVRELVSRCKGAVLVELLSEGKGGWIVRLTTKPDEGPPISLNQFLQDKGYVYTAPSR